MVLGYYRALPQGKSDPSLMKLIAVSKQNLFFFCSLNSVGNQLF